MRRINRPIVVSLVILVLLGTGATLLVNHIDMRDQEIQYSYEMVASFPHDPLAFTQGLVYFDGFFYEGTGLYGRSSLRQIKPEDGTVIRQLDLADTFFGEGITIFENRIIQLTWLENQGFVYDKDSFALLDSFTYPSEGWGLTHDGTHLIMSDGSAELTFLDPHSFEPIRHVTVRSKEGALTNLNELEYINGKVYANIWQTDKIAVINPDNGRVTGWIDLSGLLPPNPSQPVDVLNGIAYDNQNQRLFVTGKLWPTVFQIRLIPDNL